MNTFHVRIECWRDGHLEAVDHQQVKASDPRRAKAAATAFTKIQANGAELRFFVDGQRIFHA